MLARPSPAAGPSSRTTSQQTIALPPSCIGEQNTLASACTSSTSSRPQAIRARLGRECRRPGDRRGDLVGQRRPSSAYATRSTMWVRTPSWSPAASSARSVASSRSIDARADGGHGRRHRRRSRATQLVGGLRAPRAGLVRVRAAALAASTRRAAAARCATTPRPRPGAGSCVRVAAHGVEQQRLVRLGRRRREGGAVLEVHVHGADLDALGRAPWRRSAARCPRPAGCAAPARSARAARPRRTRTAGAARA